MTTDHYTAPGEPIQGRWRQLMAVLTGRGIVVRKGQPKGMGTTDYLLSSPANRDALMNAIRELDEGCTERGAGNAAPEGPSPCPCV